MNDPALRRRYWAETVGLSKTATDFIIGVGIKNLHSAYGQEKSKLDRALSKRSDLATEIHATFQRISDESAERRQYRDTYSKIRKGKAEACARHYRCARLQHTRCSWCNSDSEIHSIMCPNWNYMRCECLLTHEETGGSITILEIVQEAAYGLRPDWHHVVYHVCDKHKLWRGTVEVGCPTCAELKT